jgi:ribosome-binding protein aMBF1 (putative translation factor)
MILLYDFIEMRLRKMVNDPERSGSRMSEREMDIRKIFAERVKDLREEQGMGVRELAAKLGISHAAVSNYESCKRTPDIETCRLYAQFFNVTGDYLLGITDKKR